MIIDIILLNMLNLVEYEQQAKLLLASEVYDYFAGAAQDEITLNKNTHCYSDLGLRPRVLTGSAAVDLSIDLLGIPLTTPIIAAPTAFHCLVQPEGELLSAKAISASNSLMIISMAATQSLSDIKNYVDRFQLQNNFWFQLYIQPDRNFTEYLVRQAEQAGCKALVVTVDSPTFGLRERDLANRFIDLPEGFVCKNMVYPGEKQPRNIEFDASLSWQDITWLKTITDLPIVLKGIMHPDDALLALEHNIDAIICSNHGGRQLDTVPATIELLPDIAAAINQRIPIIIDGGIRRGTDIVKAIALGANAVAIGRPLIWGLAVDGEQGVKNVFQTLKDELNNALTLCGCRTIADIDLSLLFPARGDK